MVDFSVFDSILDAAFVLDPGGKIVYCNDAAATLCESSVRRMTGKMVLSDLLNVKEENIFPFTEQSQGRMSPTAFIETEFNLLKGEKKGKAQLAIRPVDEQHWAIFIRDVSLEEALYSKFRSELAQKEDYARNLEKLVEARTAELRLVNQTLNAILNSLGQGFFTFNSEGVCGDVFTKACEDILEGTPKGRKAWEVLGVPESEHEQFKKWTESLFKEFLPFDDMKGLGPNFYPHSQKRQVVLEYYPIRREGDAISEIVVVATDKTTEFEAQKALEIERQYAAMVVKYMKNREQFLQFLASVRTATKSLMEIAGKPLTPEAVNESFRVLHTLEGEAGTFSLLELRQLSRSCQQLLEPFKGRTDIVPAEPAAGYRNSLVELCANYEAFLTENQDIFKIPEGKVERSVEMPLPELSTFLLDLHKLPNSSALCMKFEEKFMKVPVESCLKYFDTLVQAVAERLGKKVKPLLIEGGEKRIFPEPYQPLFSSLVHAFRNAVDHGLETPDEREWGGKDPAGQIRVHVNIEGGFFHMTVKDDGKGIDPKVIREKLKTKFPDKDFDAPSDEEIIQQVCMPGFSSRDAVGEFSGRGVGLDALREEVLKIGGTLHIKSKVGEGTSIEMKFPELAEQPVVLRSA